MTNENLMRARTLASSAASTLARAGNVLMAHDDNGEGGEDAYHAVHGCADAANVLVGLMDAGNDLDTLMHKARTLQALTRAVAATLPASLAAERNPADREHVELAIEAVRAIDSTIQCVQEKLLAAQEESASSH